VLDRSSTHATTAIPIEYCVPCGFRESAVETQLALLDRFGRYLDSVALEPGHGGVFEVQVGGETIWDKEVHGSDLDLELIGDAVEERLASSLS
jgi:selenoprotein W-related protein